MTLKEQMNLDLDVFFNTGDFAVMVTYIPGDGSGALVIPAVIDFSPAASGVPADQAMMYVRESDVDAPAYRDTVMVDGLEWRVHLGPGSRIRKMGGVWALALTRDERFNGYGYQ